MGLTSWFNEVTGRLTTTAIAALVTTETLVEEAKRELDEARRLPERIVEDVTTQVRTMADEIEGELRAVVAGFYEKLQKIIDDIQEAASSAADEGVDLVDSINGAVDIVFQQIDKAFIVAIDAVNKGLQEASDRLTQHLGGLPGLPKGLLNPVESFIEDIRISLQTLAGRLKTGVSAAVETIKSKVQALTRKIGEVLGPFSGYIKQLWKLFFDSEPEQCSITAQWFDEKMRRTEKQLLNKSPGQPLNIVIKKRTFLELLPPDENSWKALVHEFLNPADTSAAWATFGARLSPVLQNTSPRDGSLVQLTLDEPFTDRLDGHQRVQISILYYRWRTESFKKVSAGFLGILAMISAVREPKQVDETIPLQIARQPPLQLDAAAAREIYKIIEPHLRARKLKIDQLLVVAQDKKARVSHQIKRRDDDGIWRDTNKA